jgi:CDP-4-dehydro-6-deoxyglucose reductase
MSTHIWQQGIVREIRQEAPATHRYFIEIPQLEKFDFEPGQFVTLDLPIGERNSERWRSYSIASAPDGTNRFELVIVKAEGGKGTEYIFNDVRVGDTFSVRGPQGKFTMPGTLDRDLFLICTGTGIAPFRSMVHHIFNNKIPHQQIHLVFGCRYVTDLLYFDEFKKLEEEHSSFHYHPTLSRDQWEGRKGYVHAVYTELASSKQPAYFYLCGWKDMITQARQTLADMGYEKKDIHFELYG